MKKARTVVGLGLATIGAIVFIWSAAAWVLNIKETRAAQNIVRANNDAGVVNWEAVEHMNAITQRGNTLVLWVIAGTGLLWTSAFTLKGLQP